MKIGSVVSSLMLSDTTDSYFQFLYKDAPDPISFHISTMSQTMHVSSQSDRVESFTGPTKKSQPTSWREESLMTSSAYLIYIQTSFSRSLPSYSSALDMTFPESYERTRVICWVEGKTTCSHFIHPMIINKLQYLSMRSSRGLWCWLHMRGFLLKHSSLYIFFLIS